MYTRKQIHDESRSAVLYLSSHIYETTAARSIGRPLQCARGLDVTTDSRSAAGRRGVRVSHPREPSNHAAEGVTASRVPSAFWFGGDAPTGAVDLLPPFGQSRSDCSDDS